MVFKCFLTIIYKQISLGIQEKIDLFEYSVKISFVIHLFIWIAFHNSNLFQVYHLNVKQYIILLFHGAATWI